MQNRPYDLAQLNVFTNPFDIVERLLTPSSEKLSHALRSDPPHDPNDVLKHFAIMKRLLETIPTFNFPAYFQTVNATMRRSPSFKDRFVLLNIAVAVNKLPRQYRSLTEDGNSCSFFYELSDMSAVYAEGRFFPPQVEENLCKQSMVLLNLFISYATDLVDNKLYLKDIATFSDQDKFKFQRIRFKSDSVGFQFFSLYKDLQCLNKTRDLLNLAEQIDIDTEGNKAKYQLLAIVAKVGENLSPRSLSARVRNYMGSDINIEEITMPRNAILHREKDLINALGSKVLVDNNIFIGIKDNLEKIKKSISQTITHIKTATTPLNDVALAAADTYRKKVGVKLVRPGHATPDSIKFFYDAAYTKAKSALVECKTIQDFDQRFPALSAYVAPADKDDLLDSFKLMDNSEISAIVEPIWKSVNESLARARTPKNQGKKITNDLKFLTKQEPIELKSLVKLREKIPLKICVDSDKQRLVLDQLEAFNNEVKSTISGIRSQTTGMGGINLFNKRIAFDDYAVTDLPMSCARELGLNQQYEGLSDHAKAISPQFESVRGNGFILLPLTKSERGYIYEDVPAGRRAGLNLKNRVMTEEMYNRVVEISQRVNFQERLECYCSFIEMANSLEIDKKSLLHSELMFSCMEKLSEEIRPQRLASHVQRTFKEFRNYLSHNGNLGDLLNIQTHEQTTLRFLFQAAAIFEDEIFPAMRLQLAEKLTIGKWVSFIGTQRLEKMDAHRLDNNEYSRLESYASHADRFPKESRVGQLTQNIIGNVLSR